MVLQLRPGLPTAWRAPGRLQLGVGERAVVLEGLLPGEEHLLEHLDGSCDAGALHRRAAASGVTAERVDALLGALRSAGALRPDAAERPDRPGEGPGARPESAQAAAILGLAHPDGDGWGVLDRRAAATAVVSGASWTGLAVARALAGGGVGTVLLRDDAPVTAADVGPAGCGAVDLGLPRGRCAARRVAAEHPGVRVAPARGDDATPAGDEPPDVVVLVGAGALDPARADALVRAGVTHLAVLWRGASAAVGPLVRPGTSTCLRCLDAHRTDRDPEWPRLLGQLSASPPGTLARPEEPALAALVGALAAAQVLAHLDGGAAPAALDAVLEVDPLTGGVAVRPWSPHPRCGCTWPERGWDV